MVHRKLCPGTLRVVQEAINLTTGVLGREQRR